MERLGSKNKQRLPHNLGINRLEEVEKNIACLITFGSVVYDHGTPSFAAEFTALVLCVCLFIQTH
jgi:hypothetical protein